MVNQDSVENLRPFTESEEFVRFTSLARSGDQEAMYEIGKIYFDNNLLPEAKVIAVELYTLGFPRAPHMLGTLAFANKDLADAKRWYLLGAQNGILASTYMLGHIAEIENDIASARKWYLDAADKGDVDSIYRLAVMCLNAGEYERAIAWFEKAVRIDKNNSDLMNDFGVACEKSGRVEQAQLLYIEAAHLGNSRAAMNVGQMHIKSNEVSEARKWILLAHKGGQKDACFLLSQLSSDVDEEISWLVEGAELGSHVCMAQLGYLYAIEEKGKKDIAAATRWFESCLALDGVELSLADEEIQQIQIQLGFLSQMSLDQEGMWQKAEMWFRLASESGSAHGARLLGDLLMLRGRISEAIQCWEMVARTGSGMDQTLALVALSNWTSIGSTETPEE